MRYGIGAKLGVIGLVVVVLLIPMGLLRGLVGERQERAREVAAEIADSSSRAQRVSGPMLVLETEQRRQETRLVTENGSSREVSEVSTHIERHLLLPERLDIDTVLETERRGRSLFNTLLVHSQSQLRARFELPQLPEDVRPLRLWVVVGLGDNRGLREVTLSADGEVLRAGPGTGIGWLEQGLQAPLPLSALERGGLELGATLKLTGAESVRWLPLGGETRVAARGDWPHPGFSGDLLPAAPLVGPDGFEAEWSVSRLSSQAQQAAHRCGVDAPSCPAALDASFAVRLVDPVDRYLMTERAMKYSLLVLVLVFGTVFVVEVLHHTVLHPVQYGLVGLALAMFFLLLLALSEHIGFGPAYVVAAAACVALVSGYLAGALGSRRSGVLAAASLGGLYALLYGLLQSEEYALLMGALALFAFLACLMLATRRIDWTRLGRGGEGVAPA